MKLSYWFVAATAVSLVFGIAFVLVPEQLLALYGLTLNDAGLLVARLFGASLVGYGLLAWFAKNAEESVGRRAIVIGIFAHTAIAFVVSLIAQLAGVLNALGWLNIAIYLLLAAGFGYFLFVTPRVAADAIKPSAS